MDDGIGEGTGSGGAGGLRLADPLALLPLSSRFKGAGIGRVGLCCPPASWVKLWFLVDDCFRRITGGVDTALDESPGRPSFESVMGDLADTPSRPCFDAAALEKLALRRSLLISITTLCAISSSRTPKPPRSSVFCPFPSTVGDLASGDTSSEIGDAARRGSDVGEDVSS